MFIPSVLCNVVFIKSKVCSCGHQGEADISRHLEGTKHKERVKSASTSQGLFECGFRLQNDPIKEQVCIKHSCNREGDIGEYTELQYRTKNRQKPKYRVVRKQNTYDNLTVAKYS